MLSLLIWPSGRLHRSRQTRAKTLRHLGRDTSALGARQFGPTRLVPKCPGSEVSWVRSVRNSATPVGTCAAKGLIRRQSTKKPIRVFLNRCRWFLKLKQLTESTSNACWSRLFHLLISLLVKKLCLTSKVLLCLTTFSVCPLRCFVVDNSNIDSRGIADQPLAILNTSMISALFRLSSKLQSPNCSNLS